jgi:signal transduction histidine kinase
MVYSLETLTAGATQAWRAARSARWLLWWFAVVQAGAGVWLAVLNHLTVHRFFAEYVVANTVGALVFATVGLLVVTKRPGTPIGWLLAITGFSWGLGSWVGQYTRYALVTRPGVLAGGELTAWLNMWIGVPVVSLTAIFLPLLFPDGRLPSPRWRPVVGLAACATALFCISQALSPGPIDASLPEVANPFAPAGAASALRVVQPLSIVLMLASLASAVAATTVRFRRSRGAVRQQIKWMAYASALLAVAIVAPALLDPASIADPAHGDSFWSGVAVAIGVSLVGVALGIAILRYRLYDIDVLINRTLVYVALTACVAALYIVVIGYLSTLFQARGNLLISLAATGLVAILFHPLRAWLQRGVNRLMFGERDDPYAVLARLDQRLEATLAPDAVMPTIVQTIKEALKLPYVAIALQQGDERVIAAEYGDKETRRQGDKEISEETLSSSPLLPFSLSLVYQGEIVGHLILAARPGEGGFSRTDMQLLGSLARHAGVAVHATLLHAHTLHLAEDLQQARERLVQAREEERLRLRRDLHDGLGPALAGLALKIDATRDELQPDAAGAALLHSLKADVQDAIADIRRLVYALRPPALDELGLVGALQIQIARYQRPDLRITLDVPKELPALSAAVEVAVYRIITEALTNVIRHAHAQHCQVRLALAGAVEIEVLDDGCGLAKAQSSGVGLVSMRERAEELGGVCVVEPAAGGGTRVLARLPM